MKSFSALLEDQTRPGVYLLKTMPTVKELEKQAKAKGFLFFHLEGQKIEKKEQFLNHAAMAMPIFAGRLKNLNHRFELAFMMISERVEVIE